ncbi:hypothetical protein AURDEDRAFT_184680 [Auricularia subglabra TFB-10046 SS5]|nr:hypothetical protein AURDEDRAFT_184680 [Auricularia subglabra TFB-10046 SS5]
MSTSKNGMAAAEAAHNTGQRPLAISSQGHSKAAAAMSHALPATTEAGTRGATQHPPRDPAPSDGASDDDDGYEPSAGVLGLLGLLNQTQRPGYARTYRRALAEHAPAPRSQARWAPPPPSQPARPLQVVPVEVVALRQRNIYDPAPRRARGRAPEGRASGSGSRSGSPTGSRTGTGTPPAAHANLLGLDVGEPAPQVQPFHPLHTPVRIQLSKHLVLNGPRLPDDPLRSTPLKSVLGVKRPRAGSSATSSSAGSSASEAEDSDESEIEEPAGPGPDNRSPIRLKQSVDVEPETNGDYVCRLNGCKKRYPSLGDLVRHRRTSAIHIERQFKCECGLSYTRPDGLKRHRDTTGHHYDAKPQKGGKGSRGGRGGKPQSRGRGGSSTRGRASRGGPTTPVGAPIPSDQTSVSPIASHFTSKFVADPADLRCRNCSKLCPDADSLGSHEYQCFFSTSMDPETLQMIMQNNPFTMNETLGPGNSKTQAIQPVLVTSVGR